MEDILAIIVVVGFLAIATLMVRWLWKFFKNRRQQEAERKMRAQKYWEEQRNNWNTKSMDNYVAAMSKPVSKKSAEKVTTPAPKTYTSTATTSSSSSVGSDDGFLSGLAAGYVINSLLHSNDSSASTTSSSSSSSSWGLDDDDSRKSISDSMSSSWSSSDSSSDSWSSSDSGPSSDW